MGKLNKLLLVAVLGVVVATPIIRDRLTAQGYLAALSGGVVLEATQKLKASVFHNTKILLVDYLPEGATGLVLNRPLENGTRWGGPVAPNHQFWLSYQPDAGVVRMLTNPVKNETEGLGGLITARFLGYAGWRPNQLQAEVKRGDWRVYPASADKISQWLATQQQ